jgi:8-oxo-dGTP diphosphatase / 2-hydroxy-dATP diphosphatase
MRKVLTLVLVCSTDAILLGMKKRGFGAGRWNGFGGKVEAGEAIEEAAVREVTEEVGIVPMGLERKGVLEFSFESTTDVLEVHIFRVDTYRGLPVETEEMRPAWFLYHEIPFSNMWADDEFWFPYFLRGNEFSGKFHFDRPATSEHAGTILSMSIEEVIK